jgi:hypothetical protein
MDIQSKLDSIQEHRQNILTLSPNQQISKKMAKLYLHVVEARDTEKNAPIHVKETETRYYQYKYGPDYKNYLKTQFIKDGRLLRQQMMDKHISQLNELNKSLSVYESVRTYLQNITEVKNSILTKIKELLNKIRRANVSTNNRKSFYIDQEQNNLAAWIIVCNCFILSYISIIVYYYIDKITDIKVASTIILLLSVVFLLPYIVNVIVKLPTSVNVYTEWGYDPTESKTPWLIAIPIGLLALYGMVYYLM